MQETHDGAQRFYAPNMSAALRMLSDAFGAEALLLSSRSVGNGVEVIGLPPGSVDPTSPPAKQSGAARTSASRSKQASSAEQSKTTDSGAERRQLDRRRGDRRRFERDDQASATASSTNQQDAGESAAQRDEAKRKQFGDTLAKLSSDHASLLGDDEQVDASSDGGMRRAASALAERIGALRGNTETPNSAQTIALESNAEQSATQQSEQGVAQELRAMRALLDDSLRVSRSGAILPKPERYLVQHRLESMGLSSAVSKVLLDSVEGDDVEELWANCRAKIAALLPIADRDVLYQGVLAIVGPAASGKSSLIAMLIARALEQGEHADVALFYLDGAMDARLAELTALAGIPYVALRPDESLQHQLAGLAHKRLLLIDLPGESLLPEQWRSEADELQLRELLVLPATGEARFLQAALRRFRSSRTLASALTFYQRAQGIGELLSLVLSERLPLALLTKGVLLPEHLVHPDAGMLLARLGFASECPQDGLLATPIVTAEVSSAELAVPRH